MPGATSKRIFEEAGLQNIAKATRERILVRIALIKSMIKRPLKPIHKRLRMERSRKYMKTDMKFVLFIDESRASLVSFDGWAKGWVSNCDNFPSRTRLLSGTE